MIRCLQALRYNKEVPTSNEQGQKGAQQLGYDRNTIIVSGSSGHQQAAAAGHKPTLCGQGVCMYCDSLDLDLLQRPVSCPCWHPLHLVQHFQSINDMTKNSIPACSQAQQK